MRRRGAWVLCAFTVLAAVIGAALELAAGASAPYTVVEGLMLAAIAVVGAVVASRVPGNPSGWLVSVIPASFATTILGTGVHDLVEQERGTVDGIALAGPWLASWSWIPAILAIAVFPQLFPTGRPLTRRWRVLLWTAAASALPLFVGTAFERGRFEDFLELRNPLGAPGTLGEIVAVLGGVGFALLLATLAGAVASLVVRWRRSSGTERQQLKWVATAALVFPVAFAAPTDDGAGEDLGFALLLLALFLLAAAVAVAILRYRLYDIDVVIRRTLVYAVLTRNAGGDVSGVGAVAGDRAAGPFGSGGCGVDAGRRGCDRPGAAADPVGVDRRFYRRRYDAERTLISFGTRLRDELDLDAVSAELQAVAAETMQPSHVTVWLREAPR